MTALRRPSSRGHVVHMHIENVSTYHKHVQVAAEHYAEAAARHPALARRVRATIGWDFRSFDEEMRDAEILVFMGLDFKPGNFRKRAPKLRWIQLTSAGIDHVSPLDWLPRGVVMTNNSGVHAEKHGEFGLTALLMLNHNVPIMTTNQRRARWHTVFGSPIRGKTVAIVGVGRIGGAAAAHIRTWTRCSGRRRCARRWRGPTSCW